jgi:hypothetical protein
MGTTDVSRTSSPFIDAVCSRPAVVHNRCCNRLNIADSLDRRVPLMHSQQRQETQHDGDVSRIVDTLATIAENFRKTALHNLTTFYHFQDDEYTIWGQSITGNGVFRSYHGVIPPDACVFHPAAIAARTTSGGQNRCPEQPPPARAFFRSFVLPDLAEFSRECSTEARPFDTLSRQLDLRLQRRRCFTALPCIPRSTQGCQ